MKVKIEYETIKPVILTISDAIKHNSKFDQTFKIENGDVEKGFEQANHVLDGTFTIGGQEQFYFETQGARIAPIDNTDEVECVISTQWQSRAQKDIASVLGVAQNKVHIKTKRLGGAFGGKETSNVIPAVAAAVAAVKFNRPIRIALERDEDMLHTGTRHPSQFHYKIGFNKDGKVISYKSKFLSPKFYHPSRHNFINLWSSGTCFSNNIVCYRHRFCRWSWSRDHYHFVTFEFR